MKPLEAPPVRHALLYDGDCAYCRKWARRFARLDWRKAFEYRPFSEAADLLRERRIGSEQTARSMQVIPRRGPVLEEGAGLRFVLLRIPLFAPAGLLFSLPGGGWILDRLYRAVARRRHALPRCGASEKPR